MTVQDTAIVILSGSVRRCRHPPSSHRGLEFARWVSHAVGQNVPASRGAVRREDLIVSVNRRNVGSVKESAAAVKESRRAGQVLLPVKHGDVSQFLVVPFA